MKSKNFTSDTGIQISPTVPVDHYSCVSNQQNRTCVLFHYFMLMHSQQCPIEHSNVFTVKDDS